MNRRTHTYEYSDPVGDDSEILYKTERDTLIESHPPVRADHPYHRQLAELRNYRPTAPWRTRVADRIISTACRLAQWVRT